MVNGSRVAHLTLLPRGWLSPRKPPKVAGVRESLPPLQRTRGAGLELAWREWGPGTGGPPLVLLHGIGGSSADWHATASHLRARRVIAFDARGHGRSDWASDEAYAVDAHFADVSTALDALEIERCLLAGFSMGGATAIMTAACLPERIAALAVVDAYPYPAQSAGSARIARWVATQRDGTKFDPAIARRFDELLSAGVSTRADLTSLWQAVECPALVVRGAESAVLPAATAARMLADLPHGRLATIDGVSHAIPHLRPRELAAILDDLGSGVDESGQKRSKPRALRA